MSIEGQTFFYPGAQASPLQILQLADEYRRAAHALLSLGRRGKPLSRAPFRLVAIHSVELCLNALLLAKGYSPADVKAFNTTWLLGPMQQSHPGSSSRS